MQGGNGAGLHISHFGHSSLSTSINRVLSLNNLLHVPHITKNLISVSQFAKDNSVFFEFHHSFCCVKDPLTGKVLLQGTLHDGLYRFPITSSPDHLPTTKLFPSGLNYYILSGFAHCSLISFCIYFS